LNDPGFNTGEVKLWIDGVLVMEKSNLKLRNSLTDKLNTIDFSAYIKNNYSSSLIEQQTNMDFDSFAASNITNSCTR
jgi:hypothetical protein